jgi:CII-binding regulator of phage lambda lysogenization HflD
MCICPKGDASPRAKSYDSYDTLLQVAADLDGVTPDVMTLIDTTIRQCNQRCDALLQSVDARLADQRKGVLDAFMETTRELRDALGTLESREADGEDAHNDLVSYAESLGRRLAAAEAQNRALMARITSLEEQLLALLCVARG